jgi:hypothetical protein
VGASQERGGVGLTVLDDRDGGLALGAGNNTLVVLHPGATHPVEPMRSGLYHLAIHLPSEPEFARVLARLRGLLNGIAALAERGCQMTRMAWPVALSAALQPSSARAAGNPDAGRCKQAEGTGQPP